MWKIALDLDLLPYARYFVADMAGAPFRAIKILTEDSKSRHFGRNIDIKICAFHITQAIERQITSKNNIVDQNEVDVKNYIGRLATRTLGNTLEGLNILLDKCENTTFRSYIKNQFSETDSSFPPRLWMHEYFSGGYYSDNMITSNNQLEEQCLKICYMLLCCMCCMN